jgi:hypothetical protein
MSHLSRDERLLALTARSSGAQAHLAGCPACRTDVEDARPCAGARPGGRRAGAVAAVLGSPGGARRRRDRARAGAGAGSRLVVAAPGWGRGHRGDRGGGGGYLDAIAPRARDAVVARRRRVLARIASTPLPRTIPRAATPMTAWALIAGGCRSGAPTTAFAPQVGQAELSISALSADERRPWRASWRPNWRRAGTGKDDRDHDGPTFSARPPPSSARCSSSRSRAASPARSRAPAGASPRPRAGGGAGAGQPANENVDRPSSGGCSMRTR